MDVLLKNDLFLFIYVTEITKERQAEGEGGADPPGEQGSRRRAPPPRLSGRQTLTLPSHPGSPGCAPSCLPTNPWETSGLRPLLGS